MSRRLNSNEADAIAFLDQYNSEYGPILNQYVIASWNYETNLTDENAAAVVRVVSIVTHSFLMTGLHTSFDFNEKRVKLEP